jgi:hypothetical protein
MHRKLLQIFELAESERTAILNLTAALPEGKFFHRSAPEKWSVSQILYHIMLSERLSLIYMKKKSQGIDTAGDSGIIEELKFIALKVSQRLPLKFKAPDVLSGKEPLALSHAEIVAQWASVRKDLMAFSETIPDKYIKRKIYKHPFAGKLNIIQAAAFIREHVNHHLPQIKRLS